MARITISYRRDDSGAITGRIFDRLVAHYGRESIFRDIDNIPLGVDFRDQINRVLDQSDIVLAIVGPRWIGPRRGQSRLDNEADPVRLEIEAVLRRNVPLIPVLVLGAPMPQANQLPESLRDFAYRNGIQVDAGQDFDTHIARLTRAMDRLLEIAAAGDSVALMRGGPVSEIEVARPWAEPAAPVAAPPAVPPTAPAPVAAPPVAAPIAAAPAVASAPRGSRLWLGAAFGLAVGGAAAAAVAVVLRPAAPPAPPEVAALAAEKQAAEARLTALQGELAAAKKAADQDRQQLAAARQQAATAQDSLEAARKDLAAEAAAKARAGQTQSDLAAAKKAAADLQARADRAESDLAAAKKGAAELQARADKAEADLAAARKGAAEQQARADKAETELAAAKKTNEQAQAQIDRLTAQLKAAGAPQTAAVAPAAAASPPPADAPVAWTTEAKRDIQRALRLLGHYQGEADGGFGSGTQAAIKEFQSFAGLPATGTLTADEGKTLLAMGQRLSELLDQPPTSPEGVAGSSIKGGEARYARAWNYQSGKGVKANLAEAAYWYALAGGDGYARALTNLGTMTASGWGTNKPDPAAARLMWWAAAVRGEAIAMYDLGVLYERGIGIAADAARAKAWYERAAAHNHPEARAALKRLAG
jgi:peptidoglycan hydrolase-like protein with peptidoglycan-binding domain